MAAYGNIDAARAGLVYGLDIIVETKIVPSGVTVDFGDAIFVDAGEEDYGYLGDSGESDYKFLGVAMVSQRSFVDSEGEYPEYDAMNVLIEGEIYVTIASGLTSIANSAAYVIDDTTDDQYGAFTTSSSGTYGPVGYFRSNVSSSLARLQVAGGIK